jgi:hypothetical protein
MFIAVSLARDTRKHWPIWLKTFQWIAGDVLYVSGKNTDTVSLGFHRGLVSGTSVDTKIHGCSNPYVKWCRFACNLHNPP